ncbi:hypothetical protein Ccrd_020202 [Cynara cardunculus var. scolymus]|uniref:Uncharacterized protein n=1 Tax=Cynara cardunculus var. scolymus TaxID=59895 RepID=A0A103Y2X3_CYNCS|nr:hypothetical protein Ccrd_020202 [Cynara cardunculus var. scolymus]
MEIDPPHESDGSTNESKESEIHLLPGNHSGYGLPYAPEDFPEPGDKWGWKVGKRVGVSGHYLDRYLYLPVRLHEKFKLGGFASITSSRGFASKTSVERFVMEAFPATDIKAFFASFTWKIPAEKNKGNKEIVSRHANCNLNLDAAGCKAGNIMCSSLVEASDPSHLEIMDCDICCIEPLFCRDCCCILCSVRIDSADGDNKSFIRCEARVKDGFICGHICHIECALRSYMAGTVGGIIGLDAEYYCRRCDARTDLIPHVKILLQSCESIHSGELSQCETDTLEDSNFKERKTGSPQIANFDYRIESLELEERIEKTLAALKKSQEGEYRIAEDVLIAQKNHLLLLYEELDKEKGELAKCSPSADPSMVHAVLKRMTQIKNEADKITKMQAVGKGFGKTSKHVLKEHFGVQPDN